MSVPKFDIGETVQMGVTFTNFGGQLADPTTIACTVRKPDNTVETVSNIRDSLGVYHAETVVDQTGTWFVHWDGSGTIDVVEEGEFYVRVRRV